MYLLKYFGKDELCQMKVSHSVSLLKASVFDDFPNGEIRERGEEYFVYDNFEEIGVIRPVKQLI